MPPPSLEDARFKAVRAQEHLYALSDHHARFLERNPYRVLIEAKAEKGLHVLRAKITEQPPVGWWSTIIGDCIHSLRCALDHVAWALVSKTGDTPTRDTAFPICVKPKAFKDRLPQIGKLPGGAKTIIESLQPYPGRDQWLRHIHKLDITDKHHHLNLVSATLESSNYTIRGGSIENDTTHFGAFDDGAEIGSSRSRPTRLPAK